MGVRVSLVKFFPLSQFVRSNCFWPICEGNSFCLFNFFAFLVVDSFFLGFKPVKDWNFLQTKELISSCVIIYIHFWLAQGQLGWIYDIYFFSSVSSLSLLQSDMKNEGKWCFYSNYKYIRTNQKTTRLDFCCLIWCLCQKISYGSSRRLSRSRVEIILNFCNVCGFSSG